MTDHEKANSYVIWNNKGGTGKSTITFQLASAVAFRNPHKRILVIDLCPQATSSMLFLGGGTIERDGSVRVEELVTEPRPMVDGRETPVRTIVGFFRTMISTSRNTTVSNVLDNFCVCPQEYQIVEERNSAPVSRSNEYSPDNLFLMCGDPNLELIAGAIYQYANPAGGAEIGTTPAWTWIHLALRKFIEQRLNDQWIVFIDTNPSFAIYTTIAVSTADYMIVPARADDASRMSTRAMIELVYGSNPPHPIWGEYTYAARATRYNIQRPRIRIMIANQIIPRKSSPGGMAYAYKESTTLTFNELMAYREKHPENFVPLPEGEDPHTYYFAKIKKFNSIGIQTMHHGMSIYSQRNRGGSISVGNKKIRIYRDQMIANWSALEPIVECIEKDCGIDDS